MLPPPASSRLSRLMRVLCCLLAGGFSQVHADSESGESGSTSRQNGRKPLSAVTQAPNMVLAQFRRVINHRTPKPNKQSESKQTGIRARDQVKVLRKGTSARSTRKSALAALPLNKLKPENRERAEEVLRAVSVFRELPTLTFEIEPDAYHFFVSHPDAAVSIWKAMQISTLRMWQTTNDEFQVDAGDGTRGVLDVLHQDDEQVLVICEGVFKSPLLVKPIEATAMIHLQRNFFPGPSEMTNVKLRAGLFVAFPSLTVEMAARIVSPVSNFILDHNFVEVSLFLHMMSQAMKKQPGWVARIADKLQDVPKVRKSQLKKVTARVYVAARKRSGALTLDEVMQPLQVGIARSESGGSTTVDPKRTVEVPLRTPRVVSVEKPVGTGVRE